MNAAREYFGIPDGKDVTNGDLLIALSMVRMEGEQLLSRIEKLDARISAIESGVGEIVSQAKPIMDEVMASPMVRMLTGGKKRGD